jgi:hypothetical protein
MEWLHVTGLIVGGVLAAASFIVSKKPDAEKLIGKIRPYQGFVGVALLALGVFSIIDGALGAAFDILSVKVLLGLTILSIVVCELLLGFLLGMPLIARWIPGESSAETRALELNKKLGVYQVTIGFVALATVLLWLLYRFEIL